MAGIQASNSDGVHSDAVTKYLEDLAEEVVAETKCVSDKYNLGKIILKTLEKIPHKLNQIDAADDSKETNGELRARVLACARALNALGLKRGDVLAVIGRNHLDICVPLFAGLVSGIAVLTLDPNTTVHQLKSIIDIGKPRIIFCDSNKTSTICEVLEDLSLSSIVVMFPYGRDTNFGLVQVFDELLAVHAHKENTFLLPSFNTEETTAVLICTSGTTGTAKIVKITHRNIFVQLPFVWSDYKKFPEPTRMILNAASIHWMTAIMKMIFNVIYDVTRIQTSAEMTPEHSLYIINNYKPTFVITGPSFTNMLLTHPNTNLCDFTCFERFYVGGGASGKHLIKSLKKRMPNGKAMIAYGITEACGSIFQLEDDTPILSAGKPIIGLNYKLMDSNGDEIEISNKPGELLVKGGNIFKGYYNDDAGTDEAITSDGYFRTGDLFYRDENSNYFFVERIKMLMKYKSYQIFPQEMEHVIMQHSGVIEAAVCGIPHEVDGEHPVACVVRSKCRPLITAQEIKDLVKNTLSPNNQLRGGVLFLERLPLLPSGKLDRRVIKEIVLGADRE